MYYLSLSDYLKRIYGQKVYKISLQSGCSCPNRDGTISRGGCSFCSEGGSGDFAAPLLPVKEQIEIGIKRVEAKLPKVTEHKFIAYFQSYTNTYGDTAKLISLFDEALRDPRVIILSIGTRPDCISDEMISELKKLQDRYDKKVWIELGLQSVHDETAKRINRGYPLSVFDDTYKRLKASGLSVIVHVIIGFPWEDEKDILETIQYLSALTPVLDGIKLQLLHILKGTRLGEEYEREPFHVLTLEEYCSILVKCLKLLPSETVVHRITGDGPKKILIAPLWSGDKKRVLNTINQAIKLASDT
ncbi:TIGR01212 family radical SAM protein [Oribacterium sp. C9]|uniref:TIGR01212 family radical SAM protein n=1 Tax=Oribacterium sp. C9 TaxID=1943579 RepID=UPI00098F1073|nr:TIGR01212 family radical SAM protein [Oribacterium sp. C9]OON87162.1 TIGR01212 family radical SAM protein [Oribacterium sp. C9]